MRRLGCALGAVATIISVTACAADVEPARVIERSDSGVVLRTADGRTCNIHFSQPTETIELSPHCLDPNSVRHPRLLPEFSQGFHDFLDNRGLDEGMCGRDKTQPDNGGAGAVCFSLPAEYRI